MENAGRACAEVLLQWPVNPPQADRGAVVVLCGPGNNGGDGFVIARHLYNAGIKVKVVLFRPADQYLGDAGQMLMALSRLRMPVIEFEQDWPEGKAHDVFQRVGRRETTWIVDAMLGTGSKGALRGAIGQACQLANSISAQRMSVDIPTGMDCDTGISEQSTFQADLTCTMIDRKSGFDHPDSQSFTGKVVVVGIGAPDEITGVGKTERRRRSSRESGRQR